MPFTFTEDDFTEAPPEKTADQAVDELAPPAKPVGPPKFTFEESDFLPPEQKPWAMAKEKIASAFDFSGGPLEVAKKVAKFATPTMPSAAYEDFQSLKEHAKSLFDQEAPTSPMARQPLAEMGISPENVPSGAEIAGAAKTGPLSVPAVAQTVSATGKMVAGLADWMTSPKGQEQMAAFEVPGLNVAMAAKFLYQMANQGWLQAEKAGEAAYVAYRTGDPDAQQAVADNLIGSIASFAGAGLVGAGAAAKAEPKTFNPQGLRGAERDALAKKVKDELQSIKEAGKANITPEQKAFWGRINAEVAGTTDAKVAEYAKSLGMDWSPIKAPGEEAPPEAPAAPTPTPPPGPPPAPPAAPEPLSKYQQGKARAAERQAKDAFFAGLGYEKVPIGGGYGKYVGEGAETQMQALTPEEVDQLWEAEKNKGKPTTAAPGPPAPTTPGPPSAETIRGDQGLIPPTGQVGEGGQEVGGNDLQQPPPGPPNAPTPPETQPTEAEILLRDVAEYERLTKAFKEAKGADKMTIWAQLEALKNRHGGKPPVAPVTPPTVSEHMDKVKAMSFEDYSNLQNYRNNYGGGFSALADEVGASVTTKEELDAILKAHDHFLERSQDKSLDINERMLWGQKKAFAREAYEIATGHQIGAPDKVSGALEMIRQKFPDFQPPMAPKKAAAPPTPVAEQVGMTQELQSLIASNRNAQQKAQLMATLAKGRGMSLKDYQEAIEAEVVRMQHHNLTQQFQDNPQLDFANAVKLYENQPMLSARTSTSVEQQAYSTPAPISVGINHALGVTPQTPILDNSGGNGMMLIGGDLSKSHAIELNPKRAENLKKLGVGTVTEGDALKTDVPQKQFEVVKVNPPFGSINSVNYDGYKITRLDHLLALRALEGMKDDGKAALVMGAKMFEGEQGKGAQWIFENYVYGHYNVVGNFELAGDLYGKQGAKWPVLVILIDGRKATPIRGELAPKDVARVNTWEEVWAQFDKVRNEIESRRSTVGAAGKPGIPVRPPGPPTPAQGPGNLPPAPIGTAQPPVGPIGTPGTGAGQLPTPPGPTPGGVSGPAPGPVPQPPNVQPPVAQPAVGGKPTAGVGGGPAGGAQPPANVPGTGAPGGPGSKPGVVSGPSALDAKPGDHVTDADIDAILDAAEGKAPPTPAKSAGLAAEGLKSTMDALEELFGGEPGAMSGVVPPEFSEEKYAKAKPYFEKAWESFKAAGKTMVEWAKAMLARFGNNIRGYLKRFMQDEQAKEQVAKPKLEPSEHQVAYRPKSKAEAFGTLLPKGLADAIHAAMDDLEKRVGDVDTYVADMIHMDKSEMMKVMSAEQIDGAAQAIDQIRNGGALIIGDQTGIGKGRQGAAVIRYAMLNGMVPVFFTKDPKLFTDMYHDLKAIHTTVRPLIFGNPAKSKIKDEEGVTVLVRAPDNAKQKAEMARVLEKGLKESGYDAIFTTYSQVNARNNRQEFLETIARDNPTVIVMDEAHEAAGDGETSMQAAFFTGGEVRRGSGADQYTVSVPGLLQQPGTTKAGGGGVLYMSATYAKRSDNMPVYFRTALHKAADSFPQIVAAMSSGGVAMQQAVSEALARAGQYTRRERDFTGVIYDQKNLAVENAQELIDHVDQVTDVLSEIVRFSGAIREAVAASTAMSETQHDLTDFASIVHNQVGQLLLAAKADAVVKEAVDAAAKGEKPVIALMNTMESFLDHYTEDNNIKPGQPITVRWNELLKHALRRTLRQSEDLPNGDTEISYINPADYGLDGAYDAIEKAAEGIESKFPVSPIDYIIQKLKNAGIEMLELTGRKSGIEYTNFETGTGTYRKFKKANKNDVVNRFNNTKGVGMLLNASGSTGLSAHAAKKFKDQSPRHMVIAQAAHDINVFVQTLGRIFRTGLVSLGTTEKGEKYGAKYTNLVLPLNAEKRPAAMTARKMKSLNANTTSETEAGYKVESEDLFNKHGDRIVSEYLHEHPELQSATGLGIELTDEGTVKVVPDIARRFTGRMAIRPDAEQDQVYKDIIPTYRELIEQLKASGEYDLEVVVHNDWDGTMQSNEQLAEGTDESNIFTAAVRAQQWEVRDSRHTPTGEEMLREFEKNHENLPTLSAEWHEAKEKFDTYFNDKIIALNAELAQYRGRDEKTLTPKEKVHKGKLEDAQRMLQAKKDRWHRVRDGIRPLIQNAGDIVEFQNNRTGETYDGMVVSFKLPKTAEKASPSNFKFRAMVNVPGGALYFSGSDFLQGTWTVDQSEKELEDLRPMGREARTTRYFLTGNPIKGVAATGGVGTMTRFNSREGQIITGLMMPRNWHMGKLAIDPRLDLQAGENAKWYLDSFYDTTIEVHNGLARVGRNVHGGYLITTPAARRTGGAIYLDQELRRITGDFEKSGNRMRVTIPQDRAVKAIDRIMKITGFKFRPTVKAGGEQRGYIDRVGQANRLGRPPTSESGGGIGGGIRRAMEHGRFGSESGSIYLGGVDEFIKRDVGPFLKKGVDAVKAMTDIIIDAFSPASATATEDVDILFKSKGDKEKVMTRAAANLDKAKKAFDKMPQAEQIAFIDRVKRGIPQPTPDLQFVAKLLRKWDDRLIAMVHRFKPDLNYLDNHYRVLWKVVPGSPQAMGASVGGIKGKRPYQGSKGFLRRHVLEDMSEGIALGGVPISYNPIEMFLLHAEDVMKYVAANRAWEGLKKTGSVVWVKNGEQRPTGYVQISDKIAKPYFRSQPGLLTKAGEWYVEEGAARMLENYLSKDHIRTGKFGPIGRVLLGLKNATTAIELGLSPFHAVFESNEVIGSSIGLGIAKLASGKIAQGLKDIATAPFTPKTTSKIGKMAIQYAKNPAEFARVYPEAYKWFTTKYPEARRMINDLFTGGGQVNMNEDYRLKGIQGFRRSIAEGNYPGAVVRAFPALSELAMNPMFNTWIPRLKVGMFLREYAFELERNNARLAAGRITKDELARKTWAFIEDRFGELNFDNLYWDRTFKSAMQILFRSVTWKLGNLRGFGKAGRDAWAEGLRPLLTGKVPRVTLPMAWLAGMAFVTAFLASIISKVSTDEYPWELAGDATNLLRNLVFPRIDKDDPRQRVSVPTYWRDLAHLIHSPVGYVGSSMTGEWRRMYDDLVNKDFYGHPIYNPNSPIEKKAFDSLVHLIPQPFGLSSFIGAKQEGVSTEKATAGFMGFTKAPAYISPNPRTQVRDMILKWKTQTGVPKLVLEAQRAATEEIEPSAYVPLRTALRNNNYEVARKELGELLQTGHEPKDIKKTMNPLTQSGDLKPLTGRKETEIYFLKSLTPNEREIYKEALKERLLIYARFKGVLAASGIQDN